MRSRVPPSVWTIGHSTYPIERFIELLLGEQIQQLADIRRFPASRRYPQFNRENIERALAMSGIGYKWLESLGGRREARPDSANSAWRNAAFRGYADYMETSEFAGAYDTLLDLASDSRTSVMCSESLWWRCHRSLVADQLRADGVQVLHILGNGQLAEHPWTAAARLLDGRLTYDPGLGERARSEDPPQQPSLL